MRTKSREAIFLFLYQKTLNSNNLEFFLSYFELKVDFPFVLEIIKKDEIYHNQIIKVMNLKSKNWNVARMPLIDFILIRMGIVEMCLIKQPTDKRIVINEILNLSKTYSTEKSASFINGILDQTSTDDFSLNDD